MIPASHDDKLMVQRAAIVRASQRAIERCYASDDPATILDEMESALLDHELCVCGHFRVEHHPLGPCDMHDCDCTEFDSFLWKG